MPEIRFRRTLPFAGVFALMGWLMMGALLCATGESSARTAEARRILVLGDSLSAAYGMSSEQGWVHLIGERLADRGWRIVNASMSGETTAGGLARLPRALAEHSPDLVVIELGANDALRGLPLADMERNLERMIELSSEAGAEVMLVGMRLPPNFGDAFTAAFEDTFRRLATRHRTALLPFLLEPIADRRDTFQPDQVHPTAEAQPSIADHVWRSLEPLVAPGPVASPQ